MKEIKLCLSLKIKNLGNFGTVKFDKFSDPWNLIINASKEKKKLSAIFKANYLRVFTMSLFDMKSPYISTYVLSNRNLFPAVRPSNIRENNTGVGSSVVGRGLVRSRPTTLLLPCSNGKTRGCYCSCKLLMMDVETPDTCWATRKRQVINLWNCCI